MANLVVTPANVQQASNASIERGIARIFILAGTTIYLHVNGQLQPSRNSGDVSQAAALGITLNDASGGQPLAYIVRGDLDPGAVLVVGETYVVGNVDGTIAPIADVLAGNFATILGIADAANNLKVNVFQGGTAHA